MRLSWKCGIVGELRSWTFSWYVLFFDIFFFCWDIDVFMKTILYFHKDYYTSILQISKKISFLKSSTKIDIFTKKNFKFILVMFVFWSFEMRCEFFMLKISHIITNFIIMWIKKFTPHFKWSKQKHNQKDFKSSLW